MAVSERQLEPLPLTQVRITGGFWKGRLDTNRTKTIPHIYRMLEQTGRLGALRLTYRSGDPDPPHIFWDSDIAKWLEAASCSLATHRHPALKKRLDATIALLAKAQQPDGYLNSHFTTVEPEKRWTNLRDGHELYCAGHLIEAGVAHFEATGERTLLDIVCRYADYIDSVFGPGKRTGYPGHEEIELALMRLYRASGRERYLRLAGYFIDERGREPHFFDAEAEARGEQPFRHRHGDRTLRYWQAHLPVRRQREAVGHAVRAMYLYAGLADLAAATGDEPLLAACRRLWQNVALRKLYVTGGVGAHHHGESFGRNHALPNESAYAETCAAIGLVFFAHRMLQIEADGAYADVMERALYNGVLSGVGLDGRTFFYVNPLASVGDHHRQRFFGCACCPPNLARLLASLGTYLYSAAADALYVHLYAASRATADVAGRTVTVTQETDYPWDGHVGLTLNLDRSAKFSLRLRVPGWCKEFTVKVNGNPAAARVRKGYATLRRAWNDGDTVTLTLAMPVERIVAHPAVAEDLGRVALARGPVVYCLEQCDHQAPVRRASLPDEARLTARFMPRVLGGCVVINGAGLAPSPSGWKKALYRRAEAVGPARTTKIRAIPYALWDNRKVGPMTVWMPRA